MANIDKDIVITPNKEQTADPSIAFSGANASIGAQTIYANVYPSNGGTISFEGSAGQLFSITNTLSGTIFSVNDVSGIPSIEVLDTGVVRLAQYNGNVGIGTSTAQAGYKLQVTGNAAVTGRVGIGTSNIFGVSNSLVVYGSVMAYGNLDLGNPAGGTSGIYFNDGTYQTTAAGTVQNSSGAAGTVQYSGGSGTFAGDATNFFWDSTNKRLGIGTGAPTNTLTVWGATPAWFNTTNGADVIELVVGNTTANSTTVGYAAAASTPYGYITATASSIKNVTFNSLGFTGIGGITLPKNTLDVGGRMVIGALYAGSAIYTAPTNGLAVQGSVGVGTSGPASTLDVNGWAGFRQGLSAAGAVTVASLTSNGAVSGTTGTFSSALYGASFNTAGTATVNALVSNGAVGGTTGTFSSALYSASFNTAGTATVNALVSNGAVSGTTGTFSSAIYGASFNTAGTATVNALVSNVYGLFGQNVTVNSANVSTSTTTGALIVAGGAGFAGNVNLGGYIQMPQMRMYSFTRTVPTVVNDAVELGSATLTNGGGMFEISIVVPSSSFSVSKYYIIPINFSENAGAWTIAQPISDGGPYSGNDFDLDVVVSSSVAGFRIRRSAGTAAGTAYVTIKQSGTTLTFVETTATASVTAPTAFYNAAVLRQVDGRVGISTSAPLSTLDVNGIISARTAFSTGGTANVNALTSNTGITVGAGGITVTGISTITGNLNVSGNINVSGTINTQNANVIVVEDPIIYIGEDNPANLWDMGLVASYNSGTYYHTGFVRNKNDGAWTLFDTLPSEPNVITGQIEWSNASITYGLFKAGNVNIVGNTRSTTSSTGAVIINGTGGIGVGGNVNVGGTISTATTATATAATHYWVQTASDNVIRPKTLANVQSEVVTPTSVSAALNAYSIKTANYTAVNNDRLLCDTSGGTFTITLPATPTLGTNITIYDKADFTAIPITVARNGSTIENLADDFSLDIGQTRNEIVYDGTTWHIYVSIGPRGLSGSNASPTSSVTYSIALG